MIGRAGPRTVDAMSTYTAQLRAIPCLAHCTRRQLSELAGSVERVDVPAGSLLLRAGDRWGGAYVIVEGEATAETQGWRFLLPKGARIERTASTPPDLTVRARTDVRALAIGRRHDLRMYSLNV
jgi:CRP-like cAMP-binding protein